MTASAGILRSELSGFVYFIQSGEHPFVKIGWAVDPQIRLSDLQCGNPHDLRILATVEGTMKDELAWHRRFSAQNVRNEWFHLTDELAEAIARCEEFAAELWRDEQPDMPISWQRYKDALRERRAAPHRGRSDLLDADKVRAIRADPRTVRAIAAAYGVSKTCVQDIRMRRTWRHVA